MLRLPMNFTASVYCQSNFCRLYRKKLNIINVNQIKLNSFSSVSAEVSKLCYSTNVSAKIAKALSFLNADIKNLNRVRKADVVHIIDMISAKDTIIEEQGILLLKCCGTLISDETPEARVKLVHDVWKTLENSGTKFSVEHFNVLLKCYLENSHPVSPEEFLSCMGNITPNENTLNLLLWCVCKQGDLELAFDVMGKIKEMNYPATETVFNALILAHGSAGNMQNALGVLETMGRLNIPPSADTYTSLMLIFAKCGDEKRLQETLENTRNISFTVDQLLNVAECCLRCDHKHLLPLVLNFFPKIDSSSAKKIMNRIIHWIHLRFHDAAFSLLKILPTFAIEGSKYSAHELFIQEMVHCDRDTSDILEICDQFTSAGYDSQCILKATETSLKSGKVNLSLELFEVMKAYGHPLRPHYFWPIFLASGKADGEKGVYIVLDNMRDMGVIPDFETLYEYFLPYVSLADPLTTVRKLQDHQLELSIILSPVLATVLKSGNVNSAVTLCKTYESHLKCEKLIKPLAYACKSVKDLPSVIYLLNIFNKQDNTDWAGKFISELIAKKKDKVDSNTVLNTLQVFHKNNLKISSYAAEVVYNSLKYDVKENLEELLNHLVDSKLSFLRSESFSVSIPHPRDMSLEELECHLVELKSKNMNPRGTLRLLMQRYCQFGDLKKALLVKQEFEDLGFEFSAGMTASLFDLYIRLNDLDAAESYLVELRQFAPNFVVDEYKILDFAAALIKNGRLTRAESVLKERASRGGLRLGPKTIPNCRELLAAVAEKCGPEETRNMFNLLTKLGYCSVNNVILGPLIRAYLYKGDLEQAVKQFVEFTVQYKVTPLQNELFCMLVDKAEESELYKSLLQEALDATRKVHGIASTHVSFIIALAEKGKSVQLKRTLLDSSLNLNVLRLMKYCERLADEDKLKTLHNLLVAVKDVPDFPVSSLCTLMLRIHSRRGDPDGAEALLIFMKEFNIKPPSDFIEIFSKLLQSHKRAVPFPVLDSFHNEKQENIT